ncbi:hypothetical protein EOL70_00070 [Leucothrix sargassi]|nr:hypothetical protein EOL70_00070 [Leucothrix sargassi]
MKVLRAEPWLQGNFRNERIAIIDSFFMRRKKNRAEFNLRMFHEDFEGLFNPLHYRNRNLFEIKSTDDNLVLKLLGNVRVGYSSNVVGETIRELIDDIAQSLIRLGKAYYFLHEGTDQQAIYVAQLESTGVFRLFNRFIQWVPQRYEKQSGQDIELSREVRILDRTKIMCFDMPTAVKRILHEQNRTLSVLDKYQFSIPQSLGMGGGNKQTNNFDFNAWNDLQTLVLCRATRSTGWSGRKERSINQSDFFICHRLIRFRRNQLLLRDSILNQLNSELSRVGREYKTDFSVEISLNDELPNISDLNELEERLVNEQVGFTEIIDYCYKK